MAQEIRKSAGSKILDAEWRESGVSMTIFARRLGVHRTTCFRWISGKVVPHGDKILLMQARLGIPASSWYEYVE